MDSEMTQTQNAILRITDEKTLQLIELYKQEECLWNTFLPEYKSREKRQSATERIARKLDVKHFEARHVVIKFKNLRNSYCQELKKIAASLNMGLSEEEVYRPRVFWFSMMDSFLRPHLQPSKSPYPGSHLPESEDRVHHVRSIGSVSNNSEDSGHSFPVVEFDESIAECSDECAPARKRIRSIGEECSEVCAPARKRIRSIGEECSEECVPVRKRFSKHCSSRARDDLSQTVKDLEAKIHALIEDRKEDYYDSFGKYIASLLRSIPKEKAMLLQPQVISLIVSGSGIGEVSVSQSDERD